MANFACVTATRSQSTFLVYLQVYKIDTARDIVYLRGSVPGPQGSIIRLMDSKKASTREQLDAVYDLPIPTWISVRVPTVRTAVSAFAMQITAC